MDERRTDRLDPVETNPDHYRPVFENERVRILEYRDEPGTVTTPHDHPDSVMVTLSGFRRRLVAGERHRDVALEPGQALWLDAQRHHGENIGDTSTHVLLIELKGAAHDGAEADGTGPSGPDPAAD
jgi:beta-alanine degradation protein BauB